MRGKAVGREIDRRDFLRLGAGAAAAGWPAARCWPARGRFGRGGGEQPEVGVAR